MQFDSYISQTGKIKKAEINCNKSNLTPILIYTGARYSFEIPTNINTASIAYDLREFIPPEPNTNLFDCKNLLDYHIQAIVNQRIHRNQLFNGKSPNELWQESYVQQELPDKKYLIGMCLRSKNPLKYGRNGIYYSVTDRTYTGDWMPLCTSKSMYLRRDIYSEDDGFLYDGEDQRGLGSAFILPSVPALWQTPEDREKLRQAFAWKKRALKLTKSFLKDIKMIPMDQQCEDYKTAYYHYVPRPNPKVIRILRDPKIDDAIRKVKEDEKAKRLQDEYYSKIAADLDDPKKDE